MTEIITTDVDALIKLMEEKREIPLQDAAKLLNIDEGTVESWATFLEEEGMIKFSYKFTKPFLIFQNSAKEEVKQSDAKPFEAFLNKEIHRDKQLPEDKSVNKISLDKPSPEFTESDLRDSEPILPKKHQKSVDDINNQIRLAIQDMHSGKFDDAKKLYKSIKESYDCLPNKFDDHKDKLADQLTDLGKQLAINIDTFKEHELRESAIKIKADIDATYNFIKSKDFDSADKKFSDVNKEFSQLPNGFLEAKSSIHEKIVQLGEELFNQKSVSFMNEFKVKVLKIEDLINQINSSLTREDISTAEKLYNDIITIKNTLPPGSMHRKVKLNQRLLQIHEDILETKFGIISSQTKAKAETIQSLIGNAYQMLKSKEIDKAEEALEDAKEILNTMPSDSITISSKFNSELSKLDSLVSKLKLNSKIADFKLKQNKILKLTSVCNRYVKRGAPDLAAAIYDEIIQCFNTLPHGFLDEKTRLKEQLLEIYRKSVLAADHHTITKSEDEVTNKFHDLVMLLVNGHKNIEARQFHSMIKDSEYANKIYESLPIGMVRKNLKIMKELNLLNEEAELFRKVLFLKKIPKSKHKDTAKVLDGIHRMYDKLAKQAPEDKQLFIYIKDEIVPYTAELLHNSKYKTKSKAISKHVKELLKSQKQASERIINLRQARKDDIQRKKKLKNELMNQNIKVKKSLESDLDAARTFDLDIHTKRDNLIEKHDKIKSLKIESDAIKKINKQIAQEQIEEARLHQEEERRLAQEEMVKMHMLKLQQEEEERLRRIQEEKERKLQELDALRRSKKQRKEHIKELDRLNKKHKQQITQRDIQDLKYKKIRHEREIIHSKLLGTGKMDELSQKLDEITTPGPAHENDSRKRHSGKSISTKVIIHKKKTQRKKHDNQSRHTKPKQLKKKTALELKREEIESKLSLLSQGKLR